MDIRGNFFHFPKSFDYFRRDGSSGTVRPVVFVPFVYGIIGYRDNASKLWGGYFKGDIAGRDIWLGDSPNRFVMHSNTNGNGRVLHIAPEKPSANVEGVDWLNGFVLQRDGKMGIGTTVPTEKLQVAGNLKVDGKIIIGSQGWSMEAPDYVFEKNYKLAALSDVEKHITANKHLSGIPSAKQMRKDGVDVIDMNFRLLKKVEELTLYVIEQDKRMKKMEKQFAKSAHE